MKNEILRTVARLWLAVVLFGCLAALAANQAGPPPQQKDQGGDQDRRHDPSELIKGKWLASVAGKEYTLDLRVDEGDLVGTVVLPNHKTVKVEDGVCVSDEFSFSTVEGEVEWEWNGTISEAGLKGERERVDNDATEPFTAKRVH